jgi:hypothetical protein
VESLELVITELDRVMEREFLVTFKAVAAEFREFFKELFGGGAARLVLSDPDDIAGTGIEIIARPPGKREQGLALPGCTFVCGDSHTATVGALGALAWGIGSSEVEHVLATQTLTQLKPAPIQIRVDGRLRPGVTPKDLILGILRSFGITAGVGHAIEYAGEAIRALPIEGRMTVCNMSIELGARFGFVAPDDATFGYLYGKPYAPAGRDWERARVLVNPGGPASPVPWPSWSGASSTPLPPGRAGIAWRPGAARVVLPDWIGP